MGALEACRLCQGHSWAAWTKKDAENPSLRCFNPVWKDGTCIWCGSGRISCKLLPKVLQTAYGETLGQKTKNGLIRSANKGSMLQKGSVYSYSITATTHWPLFVFIPEDGTMGPMHLCTPFRHKDPAVDSMAVMYARMQPGKFRRQCILEMGTSFNNSWSNLFLHNGIVAHSL